MTLMKPDHPSAEIQHNDQHHYNNGHAQNKRRNRVALRVPKFRGTCAVCGDRANGVYFGALVCLPCKSFFIRCTKDDHTRFYCLGNEECNIQLGNRMRCQYCRFQKCLVVGMARKAKPETVQPAEGQELCRVCCDIANGLHFGVLTCEGCKKFFRRAMKEYTTYTCKFTKRCTINPRSRNACRFCRYYKCLNVGMSRSAIRMGRPKKTKKRLVLPSGSSRVPSYTLASDPSISVTSNSASHPYYMPPNSFADPTPHGNVRQAVDGYTPQGLTSTSGVAYWNPHMSPALQASSNSNHMPVYHNSPNSMSTVPVGSPEGMHIKSEMIPDDCYIPNAGWRQLKGSRTQSDNRSETGTSCSSDESDLSSANRPSPYNLDNGYTFNEADVDALLQSLGDCAKWDGATPPGEHCMPHAGQVIKQEAGLEMEEDAARVQLSSPDSVFVDNDVDLLPRSSGDNITTLESRTSKVFSEGESSGLLEHLDASSLHPPHSVVGRVTSLPPQVVGRVMSLSPADNGRECLTGPSPAQMNGMQPRGSVEAGLLRCNSMPAFITERTISQCNTLPLTSANMQYHSLTLDPFLMPQIPDITNLSPAHTGDPSMSELWNNTSPMPAANRGLVLSQSALLH